MVAGSVANIILDSFFARAGLFTYNESTHSYSVAFPLSESCYIGVSTTTPTLSGGAITNFTEPTSSTGYKRSRLGLSGNEATYIMDAATNSSISNGSNFIFFDEAVTGGGGFGTVTWLGLFSAESGGAPVIAGALTSSVTVNEGNVLIFRPGNLTVSME